MSVKYFYFNVCVYKWNYKYEVWPLCGAVLWGLGCFAVEYFKGFLPTEQCPVSLSIDVWLHFCPLLPPALCAAFLCSSSSWIKPHFYGKCTMATNWNSFASASLPKKCFFGPIGNSKCSKLQILSQLSLFLKSNQIWHLCRIGVYIHSFVKTTLSWTSFNS